MMAALTIRGVVELERGRGRKCSAKYVYAAIQRGGDGPRLKATKVAARWYVEAADWDQFLEAETAAALPSEGPAPQPPTERQRNARVEEAREELRRRFGMKV